MKYIQIPFILELVLLTLSGCEHYKPMDFPRQNGDQESPGLFSGKKGRFEINMPAPWHSNAEEMQENPQ